MHSVEGKKTSNSIMVEMIMSQVIVAMILIKVISTRGRVHCAQQP